MLGPAVRRCLPSGQWSGNVAQCKNLILDETLLNEMVKISLLKLDVTRLMCCSRFD